MLGFGRFDDFRILTFGADTSAMAWSRAVRQMADLHTA